MFIEEKTRHYCPYEEQIFKIMSWEVKLEKMLAAVDTEREACAIVARLQSLAAEKRELVCIVQRIESRRR